MAWAAREETPAPEPSIIPVPLAETAVLAARERFPDDSLKRGEFIEEYAEAYLDFLRLGGAGFERMKKMAGGGGRQAGFDAARAAILDPKTRMTVTPANFGYGLIIIDGTYRGGFEVSEFKSDDGEAFEISWGETPAPRTGSKVRVIGYVSPKTLSRFGHMGAHDREIIVTNHSLVPPPPAAE